MFNISVPGKFLSSNDNNRRKSHKAFFHQMAKKQCQVVIQSLPELEDLHHINSHVLSDFVAQHYTGQHSSSNSRPGCSRHEPTLTRLSACSPALSQNCFDYCAHASGSCWQVMHHQQLVELAAPMHWHKRLPAFCHPTSCKLCAGKRLVLAGAGLHHQQLVDLAAPMLEALPAGQDAADIEPASQYQGAHVQLAGSAPHANLILAFEYPGGWRDIQVIICFVLCMFRGWEGLQCLIFLHVSVKAYK
jgi:hypothetical protein